MPNAEGVKCFCFKKNDPPLLCTEVILHKIRCSYLEGRESKLNTFFFLFHLITGLYLESNQAGPRQI